MNEKDIMIEVNHMSHIYTDENGNDVHALNDVNLSIKRGEFVCIIGTNGSGKSTLLRLLIGLQRPTSGQIIVDGTDITTLSEDEFNTVRRKMGMVFQYSALFDSMSVGENVAFGLRQHTDLGDDEIKTHCSRTSRLGRFKRV